MYEPGSNLISKDPLGQDGVTYIKPDPSNLYRFVRNDPVNETDPSGMGTPEEIKANPATLEYFQNVGWIDWNHANIESAAKLIKVLKAALEKRGAKGKFVDAPNFSESASGLATEAHVPVPKRFLEGKGYVTIEFQNPATSFKTKFAYPKVLYVIKADIPEKDVLPVALGIFRDYQTVFEYWQEAVGPNRLVTLSKRPNYSGFSQEDLFSDIVGFYTAARPDLKLTRDSLTKEYFGKKLSTEEALALLKSQGNDLGWPRNKNREFKPVNLNEKTKSLKGEKMQVPAIFSSIDYFAASKLWWVAEPENSTWVKKLVDRARKVTEGIKEP